MRSLLAGMVLVLLLASCSSGEESAETVGGRLAEALERGELPADLFTGESPQSDHDEVVAGLTEGALEATRVVRAAEVREQDGAAEVSLSWSWELDGHSWSYESTGLLTEVEGTWRAVWSPSLVEPTLTEGETLTARRLAPDRGDVLGAGGTPLVTERPVVRHGIDKTRVSARRAVASARRAARVLDVAVRPFVRAVRAAGERAFVEAIALRPEDAREVGPAYSEIPGAVAIEDHLPLAPTREFAAPLLGRVGPVTAELVEESAGRLQPGDVVGLSGLQARYDEQLTGTPGVEVAAVEEDGTRRALLTRAPVDGAPLRTTLDRELQLEAERLLAAPHLHRVVSAVVALRPSTGAVLAAANGPGNAGLNAATYGQYAPGSTFKVVSALALLRSGLTPGSAVECPADVVVDGKTFENYGDYPTGMLGRITLRQAVAHSCNTAFIGARDRAGAQQLAEAAEALGFGADHDVGFPAYFGQVPAAQGETEAAANLIGQGRVLASPLAMATVAASVAAEHTVVPHLVEGVTAEPTPRRALTGGEAAALRSMMRAVATEGSAAFLGDLPGPVGAKTGTAEHGDPRPDGTLATHAWMVGTRGDLAVAVFVERGESGSRTAGPLLEALLS